MYNKIRNIIVSLASLSLVALPIAMPAVAYAAVSVNIGGNACSGTNIDLTGGSSGSCTATSGTSNIQDLLRNIINYFSIIVGVIAVVMIIVGGLRYITSGGESGKVGSAKTTIIYALVGLVVVALAQLVVHFVLGQANTLASGG